MSAQAAASRVDRRMAPTTSTRPDTCGRAPRSAKLARRLLALLALLAAALGGRCLDLRRELRGRHRGRSAQNAVERGQQPEAALLARDDAEIGLLRAGRIRHARARAAVGVGDHHAALLVDRDVVEVEQVAAVAGAAL